MSFELVAMNPSAVLPCALSLSPVSESPAATLLGLCSSATDIHDFTFKSLVDDEDDDAVEEDEDDDLEDDDLEDDEDEDEEDDDLDYDDDDDDEEEEEEEEEV